jgi:TPR repeat protein
MDSAQLLRVTTYDSPLTWIWQLESGGRVVGAHEVRLGVADPMTEAWLGLLPYLRSRGFALDAADTRTESLRRLAEWARHRLFGAMPLDGLDGELTIHLPGSASALIAQPLELGLRRDSRLRLSYLMEDAQPLEKTVPTDLRVLVGLAMPRDLSPLSLRRERRRLTDSISARMSEHSVGCTVHIVEYGLTRAELASVAATPGGWDVVHLAGHGMPGGLLLESDTGRTDSVGNRAVVNALLPTASRLSLLTLNACDSASSAIRFRQALTAATRESATANVGAPALAAACSAALDCTVLSMRYPVDDRFAADLVGEVYPALWRGAGVTEAVRAAVERLTDDRSRGLTITRDDVRIARHSQPGLFTALVPVVVSGAGGLRKVALLSALVEGAPPEQLPEQTQQRFPERPERLPELSPRLPDQPSDQPPQSRIQPGHLVGRAHELRRLRAWHAATTVPATLFLCGPPGIGKTAVALEFAYLYPATRLLDLRDEADHAGAMLDAALRIGPGEPLIVDHAEAAIGEGGRVSALLRRLIDITAARGGKTIVVSRRAPSTMDLRVEILQIEALSAAEARSLIAEIVADRPGQAWPQTGDVEILLRHAAGHPGILETLAASDDPSVTEELQNRGGGFLAASDEASLEWLAAHFFPLGLQARLMLWLLGELFPAHRLLPTIVAAWQLLVDADVRHGAETLLAELIREGMLVRVPSDADIDVPSYHPHPIVRSLADYDPEIDDDLKQRARAAMITVLGSLAGPYPVTQSFPYLSIEDDPESLLAAFESALAAPAAFADVEATLEDLARLRNRCHDDAQRQRLDRIIVFVDAQRRNETPDGAVEAVAETLAAGSPFALRFGELVLGQIRESGDYHQALQTCVQWIAIVADTRPDWAYRLHLERLLILVRSGDVVSAEEGLAALAAPEGEPDFDTRAALLRVNRRIAQVKGDHEEANRLQRLLISEPKSLGAVAAAIEEMSTYPTLMAGQRFEEAKALLTRLRAQFEAAGDVRGVVQTTGALADVADTSGNSLEAVPLGRAALIAALYYRLWVDVTIAMANLANFVERAHDDARRAHALRTLVLLVARQHGIDVPPMPSPNFVADATPTDLATLLTMLDDAELVDTLLAASDRIDLERGLAEVLAGLPTSDRLHGVNWLNDFLVEHSQYSKDLIAGMFADQQRHDEVAAEGFYRRAAAAGEGQAMVQLADLYVRQERYDEAVAMLGQAWEAGESGAAMSAARIQFARGRRAEAKVWLLRVVEQGTDDPVAVLELAKLRIEDSEQATASLVEACHDADEAFVEKIVIGLVDVEALTEAAAVLADRRAAGRLDVAAHTVLGGGYGRAGDLDRASAHLRVAAEAGDRDAAKDLGGLLLLERGDQVEGRRWLRAAVDAGQLVAAYLLGDNLIDGDEASTEDIAEGLRLLHIVANSDHPVAENALVSLGNHHLAAEKLSEAAGYFLRSGRAEALNVAGRLFERLDDLDNAERVWQQAANLGDDDAMVSLAYRYYETERYADAIPLLTKAHEGGNRMAANNLGAAHAALGNVDEARYWFAMAAAAGDESAAINLERLGGSPPQSP